MTDTEPDPRIEAVAKLLFTGPFVQFNERDWNDALREGWPVVGKCRMAAEDVLRGIDETAEWEYGIQWRPDGAIHWEWDLDELRDLTHVGTTTWRRRASGAAEEFTAPTPEAPHDPA